MEQKQLAKGGVTPPFSLYTAGGDPKWLEERRKAKNSEGRAKEINILGYQTTPQRGKAQRAERACANPYVFFGRECQSR